MREAHDAETEEFVWRFRIDELPASPVCSDPVLELVRIQWEELLKLCIPLHRGRPVQIDGFAMMRSPQVVHPVHAGGDDGGDAAAAAERSR
jgi:hypothetical protein